MCHKPSVFAAVVHAAMARFGPSGALGVFPHMLLFSPSPFKSCLGLQIWWRARRAGPLAVGAAAGSRSD